MNPFKLYDFEKLVRKGDILCALVPLKKTTTFDKDGKVKSFNLIGDIDDMDEDAMDIEEHEIDHFYKYKKKITLSISLDYIHDSILREIETRTKVMLEKIKNRTIVFYRCNKAAGWYKFNSPSTFDVERSVFEPRMDVSDQDIDFIGSIQCSLKIFAPLATSHRRFFNYYESNEVSNSLDVFYKRNLEQQMATLTYAFRGNPVACSIALLSHLCKTNRNCFSSIQNDVITLKKDGEDKSSVGVSSYCFFKIQNHVLILFGLAGRYEFVRDALIRIHKSISEHKVIHIIYPKDQPPASTQLMSWTKIESKNVPIDVRDDVEFLDKFEWEQRSYIFASEKDAYEPDDNIRIRKNLDQ